MRWFDDARHGSFTIYNLVAWHAALVPSLLLVLAAHAVLSGAGVDVSAVDRPAREAAERNVFFALAASPLIETLLLSALIEGMRRLTARVEVIAVLSALAWGAAHAFFHPFWFFGTVWSFYVFSRGYLAWRPVSYKHAFGAAAVPHALVNASALLLQFFARNR